MNKFLALFSATTLYLSAALAQSIPFIVIDDACSAPILSPSFQKREVKKIQLPNGLQAYLVSDPLLDKSAAALQVDVGSWSDPEDGLGMAHFLEHLLFLGTEKYPDESEYGNYITSNGGFMNAFTSGDRTVYYFAISTPAFAGGLDRFAQFFIHPLFKRSGVQREMHAVDQEWAKNIQQDSWRAYFIQKALGNPDHPNQTFAIGNLQTLSSIQPERLIEWYQTHYSANLMTLAVASPLPMDELISYVLQNFNDIANYQLTPLQTNEPLNNPSLGGHLIAIKPFKDLHQLILQWELPAYYYDDLRFLSLLLNSESKASLLSALKKEGYIENIHCAPERFGKNNLLYEVSFDLTPDGVLNWTIVAQKFFQTIAAMKATALPSHLHTEFQRMSKLHFAYPSRSEVSSLVLKALEGISFEGIATYPEKTYILPDFDAGATQNILYSLQPKSCQFYLIASPSASGIEPDQSEPWLGGQYKLKPLNEQLLTQWSESSAANWFQYPEKNPFVPSHIPVMNHQDFSSDGSSLPKPSIVGTSPGMRLYFAKDTRYGNPQIAWKLRLSSKHVVPQDAKCAALLHILCKAVEEQFQETAYSARAGGLHYGIYPEESWGLKVNISGFSPKALDFLQQLLQNVRHIATTEKQFQRFKTSLKVDWQNNAFAPPLVQGKEIVNSLLEKDYVSTQQKLEALQNIDFHDFQEFAKNFSSQAYVQGLFYGDLSANDAQKIPFLIKNHWLNPPVALTPPQPPEILRISEYSPCIRKTIAPDGNASILLIQADEFSFKNRAAHQILSKGLKEPFFSELRTKQQTGYIVGNQDQEIDNQLYMYFFAQTTSYDPRDLLARFDLFNEKLLLKIDSKYFTEERFDALKQAFIDEYSQPPKNMQEMADLLDQLAFDYYAEFDRIDKRRQAFQEIRYDEFLSFTKNMLHRSNKKRLAVLIEGSAPAPYYSAKTIEEVRREGQYVSMKSLPEPCPE